jgi:hypothetical protein
MSIICYGDVHGKVEQFSKLIDNHNPKTPIFQIGDMGAGFGFIPRYPDNVKWIRGNHDDPKASREHPNYLGDWGYLPEHKMFYLAGAWSIDYAWRQDWNKKEKSDWLKWKQNSSKPARQVWWEDEELSQPELDAAVALYAETKPEIMISHEAPASIVPHVLSRVKLDPNSSPMFSIEFERQRDYSDYNRPEKLECIKTRTSTTLQTMLDIWRPKFWCFGHYHISKIIDTGSTLFKCCAELEPFRIPDGKENI